MQPRSYRELAIGLALAVGTAVWGPAHAASVVNVRLQDTSTNGSLTGMRMTADPSTVKAGRVTIHAMNQSRGLIHEVVVVRTNGTDESLPYDPKKGMVIESRVRDLGEISDLAPGKSGSLTVNLSPGSYLLICNQPGHYKAGMRTTLTVAK